VKKGSCVLNSSGLVKYSGAAIALVVCSACGGGTATVPSSPAFAGATVRGAAFANGLTTAARPNVSHRYESMVSDVSAESKSKYYEYIFNEYGTYAGIFNYPTGVKEIDQISGLGGQGCTNALYGYGKGIFWNVGGPDQITEFKVPKTPIKTLSVNYSFATSCAMNTSGDLAVGIYGVSSGKGGELVVFKNASGKGKVYETVLDEEFFDGYDDKGNLFADGFTGNRSGWALVELPKGSKKAVTIETSNAPTFPGSVQWDGTYVTVFDQLTNSTYQYTVSGTTATLKHTITYTGMSDCAQTWIVTGLLYCADAGNDSAEVFKYPKGGAPVATFTGDFDEPLGVTAAQK
jgi:hypothetical protein